jgi:hypothetical protein
MWLLPVAALGLLVPNGLFVYWLARDYHGFAAILQDRLALAFILDAALALVVLSVFYARAPIGRVRWPWFVILSLVGGLGFSLPFYHWLGARFPLEGAPRPGSRATPPRGT